MKMLMILLYFLSLNYFAVAYRFEFVKDFIEQQNRATNIVSFLNTHNNLSYKHLLANHTVCIKHACHDNQQEDHALYMLDLKQDLTRGILLQAQKNKLFKIPARWLLFYKADNNSNISLDGDYNTSLEIKAFSVESIRNDIQSHLAEVDMGINTEVYIAVESTEQYYMYLAHRKAVKLPLIFEKYGTWTNASGFTKCAVSASLPIRRCDMSRLPVVATLVFSQNDSVLDLEEYLRRDVDTMTKYTYYMVKHLFEWVNGSGYINVTNTWGYKLQDGQWNGMVRELYEARADISSPLVTSIDRLAAVEYVAYPAKLKAVFVFKKPALASVTNIFMLPFSRGVWAAVFILIVLCSLTLFYTTHRERKFVANYEEIFEKPVTHRISDSILDTLCLVFQQGTAQDPTSLSARQILVLGLLAFMFLFTAYSANVVSLLQTSTNEINSVTALMKSPLRLGVQDVAYNKYYFTTDVRPAHQALYRHKLKSLGEKAYITTEEGIRRVREGMFAFHVEDTAGYDEIQRTFLENEKCNLGEVKFIPITYPYVAVAKQSQIKEQLKIGIRRILESGVQSRSSRRVLAARPSCGASVAMFSAVSVADVAPAFKCLLIAVAMAVCLLFIEIAVHSRQGGRTNRMCI